MDVAALRASTPGCAHRVHLNNAGAGLLTRPTLDAMTGHLRREAEIGGYEAEAAAREEIADCYAALAELLGGRPEQIALFDNATHAWNAAFYSIPFAAGDRILTGRAEYGSNVLAFLQQARRIGVEVVVVDDDEHGQLDVAELERLVDQRTRLIAVSHIPTGGGLVNPAAEIGRVARAADVLYLLDACQSVGQRPLDVDELGVDLLTGTGRKFLRGPRGTGFLWAGPRALDRLEPFVAEIGSAEWTGGSDFAWADGARRFESWECSYAGVLGLGAAVRQALEIGLPAIAERAGALGARLRERLAALPGVSTHDLGVDRCAIVTIAVRGTPAEAVAAALAAERINVTTTVPGHAQFDDRGVHPLVRLSPHYYNTEDELDRAVEVISRL